MSNYFISHNAGKLTEESEVIQLLHTGLKSGIIKPDMPAKFVLAGIPKFQEYKLDTFRTRLNRIKQYMRDNRELADRTRKFGVSVLNVYCPTVI